MELKIKLMGGDERSLKVRGDPTVGELKQLISELFREPPYKQRLSAENGSLISLDSKKLSEYGLHSGSVVILLISGIGTYDVDVNETVDQLQTKIYNKERVPEDQQKLIYKGKGLESGKKLQDYNITSGDTIYMTLRLRGVTEQGFGNETLF
uniref:ISG15 ubiquitin like modifier n=1 Tax=Cyprinus carpio carpio TaxID=630221 RepID=A0A8C1F8Y9_CYPCA